MGLDISVIRTPKTINLEEIYALLEAIESGYDWYLGEDMGNRAQKWVELKDKCKSLTRQDVLAHTSEPEDLVKCLNHISDSDFNTYLAWIVSSITKHEDGNTHLNFDYDRLPGKTIMDSRSWNLRDLFMECRKDDRRIKPCGDSIYELNPYKICVMGERWNRMSLKLCVARWIGYFAQSAGYRILIDCAGDLGIHDSFIDFQDMKHYQESIKKVVDESIDTDDRLWLVSSY